MIEIALSFEGNEADSNELDLYDAAQAMMGFQRSLALTTHLLLNGKVITKAPFLKNAQIFSTPPEEGSWKMTAIIATSIFSLATAPKDSDQRSPRSGPSGPHHPDNGLEHGAPKYAVLGQEPKYENKVAIFRSRAHP